MSPARLANCSGSGVENGLEQLRDIHSPDPVGWWVPAPGYWLILLLAIALLVYWMWRHRRYQLRRVAVRELEAIVTAYESHQDDEKLANEISTLLRRVAISFAPRKEVASALGQQWIATLQALPESHAFEFSEDVAEFLSVGLYQRHSEIPIQQLISECRQWIGVLPKREGLS